MKLISGALKIGIAAAAAYGVYSLFKDEIRETNTYQQLNEKYDVDKKVESATVLVKDKMKDTAKTVSSAAKAAREMATEKFSKSAPEGSGSSGSAAGSEAEAEPGSTAEAETEATPSEEAAADIANYSDVSEAVSASVDMDDPDKNE